MVQWQKAIKIGPLFLSPMGDGGFGARVAGRISPPSGQDVVHGVAIPPSYCTTHTRKLMPKLGVIYILNQPCATKMNLTWL